MYFASTATSTLFFVASVTGYNLRSYNDIDEGRVQKLQNKIDLLEELVMSMEEPNSAEDAEEKIIKLRSKINFMKSNIESSIPDEEKQLEELVAAEEGNRGGSGAVCYDGNDLECAHGLGCGRFDNNDNAYQCCACPSGDCVIDGVFWCRNGEGGACSDGYDNNCANGLGCGRYDNNDNAYQCCACPSGDCEIDGIFWCRSGEGGACTDGNDNNCAAGLGCGRYNSNGNEYKCCKGEVVDGIFWCPVAFDHYFGHWNLVGSDASKSWTAGTSWSSSKSTMYSNTFKVGLSEKAEASFAGVSASVKASQSYSHTTSSTIGTSHSGSFSISCTSKQCDGYLYQWEVKGNAADDTTQSVKTCDFTCLGYEFHDGPRCPFSYCNDENCHCCNKVWQENTNNITLLTARDGGECKGCTNADDPCQVDDDCCSKQCNSGTTQSLCA